MNGELFWASVKGNLWWFVGVLIVCAFLFFFLRREEVRREEVGEKHTNEDGMPISLTIIPLYVAMIASLMFFGTSWLEATPVPTANDLVKMIDNNL